MKRIFGSSLWLLVLAFIVTSCGGGGGAGSGGIYSGATTQAALATANANEIFSFMWSGGMPTGSIPLAPAVSKAASSNDSKKGRIVSLARSMAARLTGDAVKFSGGMKKMRSAVPVSDTIPGAVSGTLTMNGSIDDVTYTGSVTMTYTNFNDGDGYTVDGVITMRVDGFDRANGSITDATMSFTSWTMKAAGFNITFSGSMRMQESAANGSETLTINMDGRDNIGNDSFRFENYVETTVYDNFQYPPTMSETYSGRVYVGKYGYVDVSTVSPCGYANPYGNPDSGGPIILAGAGNTKAAITPLSASYVKIEVDADGDGVYEDRYAFAWSNLNGDPIDVSAVPPEVPSAPTGLTAAWGDKQVFLSWNVSAGATSYRVYDATSWSPSLIANPAGTSYAVTGLTNGGYYCYEVSAVNTAGESGRSLMQCGSPNVAPPAPTGVSAAAGDGQVVVSWEPVSDIYVNSYYIYWSTSPGVTKSSPNRIQTYAGYTNTYTHTGLANGTTYYYIVTTANTVESAGSSEVSARPQAGSPAPTTLAAGNVKDTSTTLNGSLLTPSGYTTEAWFEYGTSTAYGNSTTHSAYAYSGAISLSANISSLAEGTTYHYRVVAQNSAGTFYGSDKTFTTLKTPQLVSSGDIYAFASDGTTLFWGDGLNLKYGLASGGTATTLATGFSPYSIAIDATNVYSADGSTVRKINRATGAVTTLASGFSNPTSLAVDETHLYWREPSAIRKVNISGVSLVTDIATGLSTVSSLAIDRSHVYWIDNGGIKKASKSGGMITALNPDSGSDIAVDSGNLYWRYVSFPPAPSAYYGAIKKMSISGGLITTVVGSSVERFTVDGTDIYFSDWGSIKKVSINGGLIIAVCISPGNIYSLTLDAANVYWNTGGGLYKMAK